MYLEMSKLKFTDLIGNAEILRRSFWWLYQKGWISKESVSEEDYRDLGLEFPDGYERFDREEVREERYVRTRLGKRISLEKLKDLI
ncbi:MAG: hypothetical protein DRO36_06475 [Candidatus Hecatellales archaeon]|nr:MAG: hypothetical protein DRO36_06475 [Candidatus Hecatellales archaeon]